MADLTDTQKRELRRLRAEGLTEEQALELARDRQFDVPPPAGGTVPKARSAYVDQDTTDEYLDKEPIRYTDGSTTPRGEELDRILEQARRGERTLPPLPPPIDR